MPLDIRARIIRAASDREIDLGQLPGVDAVPTRIGPRLTCIKALDGRSGDHEA